MTQQLQPACVWAGWPIHTDIALCTGNYAVLDYSSDRPNRRGKVR
jgi:hypothetical protein